MAPAPHPAAQPVSETQARQTSLWRHADFLKLWAGQSISELGSRITRDGLPLLAVTTLGATPVQMGLLNAAGAAPALLVGLFAGVWVDRSRRRPILIAADIGQAGLLLLIPMLALTGHLNILYLMVIGALVGALTVVFGIAYRAYLPTLVERSHIVEGNSKLSLSDSIAELAGPGLAGVLIQAFTAPVAILIDALSFAASIVTLTLIRKPEPPALSAAARQPLGRELSEGLRAVTGQPVLRALAGASATDSFFGNFIGVLYALYAVRELGIGPALLGLTIAAGGASSLAGALFAVPVLRWFGLGPALISTRLARLAGLALLVLAGGTPAQAVLYLIGGQLVGDGLMTIYSIHAVSLIQGITPDRLLGRVNASMELLAAGLGPLGALTGGILGEILGVRPTLLIAAVGIGLGVLWLVFSPVWRLRAVPETSPLPGSSGSTGEQPHDE